MFLEEIIFKIKKIDYVVSELCEFWKAFELFNTYLTVLTE